MTPDELMSDLLAFVDPAQRGGLRTLLWEIFADVQSSYRLAIESAGVDAPTAREIELTVTDYLTNHYGDD